MADTILAAFYVLVFVHSMTCVTSQDAEQGVQEIVVPMCKNLVPYNLTKLPNALGYQTQLRAYREMENWWPYMDMGCSTNLRTLVCSTLLPKYDPASGEVVGPCKGMCNRAKKKCSKLMRRGGIRWSMYQQFRCNTFPTRNCLRPMRENRDQVEYPYCTNNPLPLCASMPYAHGYLPNMFLQFNVTEVSLEFRYYDALLESQCSPHLAFFLCGTYMPYCVRDQFQSFSVPCQELCGQVKADCEAAYNARYHGIPWPSKLQCHRYPLSTSGRACAMPGDVESQVNVGLHPEPAQEETVQT